MADKAVSQHRRRRSLFHREEGQAALEFVMVLPICIIFILVLLDLGIMMYEFVSVSNAVREGARFGSVNCGPTGACSPLAVQTRTISRSGGILTATGEVTVRWLDNDVPTNTNRTRGDSVVVSVSHPYAFLFFPITAPIISCADMRLEQTDKAASLPDLGGVCPP
jgi:hypothetical protein